MNDLLKRNHLLETKQQTTLYHTSKQKTQDNLPLKFLNNTLNRIIDILLSENTNIIHQCLNKSLFLITNKLTNKKNNNTTNPLPKTRIKQR